MQRGSLNSLQAHLGRSWREHWPAWLFAAALGVVLFTRLYAIADYPMYFFTDEAVQTVLALDLWHNGLRSASGEWLPTFFRNVYQYNLGVSVYLQLIPAVLLGKSVEVTRSTAALASLLAPLWLGLSMARVYRRSYAWLAVLVLAVTPAWFLHSRTAFECSLAVSWYSGLLYFYLRYRGGSPRALYAAILCGALAFYSYSPAQMVVGVSGLLLLITDWQHHRRQSRRLLLGAAALALACALPILRFQLEHPAETFEHLRQIGSYLVEPLPWIEKAGRFLQLYLGGLNPLYWFLPGTELARHTMGSLAALPLAELPFAAAGIGLAAWRVQRWEYRVPLLALLAAPSGAALAGLGITRLLFEVVPLTLLAVLAGGETLDWAARRWRLNRPFVSLAVWVVLAECCLFLLVSALVDGPTWSRDYGLNGMQYGARQVFGEILSYTQAHPGTALILTPTWANGTDVLARFFLPDPLPVELAGIDSWLVEKRALDERMLFILTPEELERAQTSGKFSQIQIERSLPYPDGRPGFYFLHLRYVDNIDEILLAELRERLALDSAELSIAGQPAALQFSRLDMGEISSLFDNDPDTFVRTLAANPLVLRLDFTSPRPLKGLALRIGGTASTLDVSAEVQGSSQMYRWHQEVPESSQMRLLGVDFGQSLPVRRLELFLKNTDDIEPGHVHLWELQLK